MNVKDKLVTLEDLKVSHDFLLDKINTLQNDITTINGNLLKVASYSNQYTVTQGQVRTIWLNKESFGLKSSDDIRGIIVTNGSQRGDLYHVSHGQWSTNSNGVWINITNSSVQADIPIWAFVFYI